MPVPKKVKSLEQALAAESLSKVQELQKKLAEAEIIRVTARQTFFEMVGDRVIEAVKRIPSLPPVKPPTFRIQPTLHEEHAVLVISDVQAGLTTSARETGGLGEFNTKILLEEIEYLGDSVESIMKYHTNVKVLHVWFNGDIVEGEDIFPGQLREIDMSLVQQIVFCVEHFARLLYRLAGRFVKVICGGVVGNHGRIGRKGEHSPMSNFDYLVYKWLEERTRPLKNVTWEIPETWWQVHEIFKWRFLCVHGDDTGQSTWGIPFYSIGRHKNRYQEMLRRSGLTPIDYMVVGHHSERAEFHDIISAGSWPGGTEFSIKRLQALDIPTAPFFGVDKRHGKTWRRDIQLRPVVARRAA